MPTSVRSYGFARLTATLALVLCIGESASAQASQGSTPVPSQGATQQPTATGRLTDFKTITLDFDFDPAAESVLVTLGDSEINDDLADAKLMEPSIRLFQPKVRVYFDLDDKEPDRNELDIFEDGSLAPSINFVELAVPLWEVYDKKNWIVGLNFGVGMSVPAQDSLGQMGMVPVKESAGIPVVIFTGSLFFEFPLQKEAFTAVTTVVQGSDGSKANVLEYKRGATFGIELGIAHGISPEEGLDSADDTAWFVGFTLSIPF